MSVEIITIPFKDKMINLHFEEFDNDIDIDRLTTIDYHNLYAELITVPALMNRVGIWKAEANNALSEFSLDLSIFEAKKSDEYRKSLIKRVPDGKSGEKVKYPTIGEVEDAVTLDIEVQTRRRIKFRRQKEAEYMDSLYWAVKSKEGKLNRISENMKLMPEDFEREIIEGKWNGILIQAKNKAI